LHQFYNDERAPWKTFQFSNLHDPKTDTLLNTGVEMAIMLLECFVSNWFAENMHFLQQ